MIFVGALASFLPSHNMQMFAAKTLDLVHTILSALVVMGPTKESFYAQAHTYRRLSLHI